MFIFHVFVTLAQFIKDFQGEFQDYYAKYNIIF